MGSKWRKIICRISFNGRRVNPLFPNCHFLTDNITDEDVDRVNKLIPVKVKQKVRKEK